ncbi:GroES-like protein [Mollisia scopiformis]|uniref:GroES-like protein n=1 Tax=Mollisia scopiformis TaxID=149040 RepID=A0A194XES2_MOLSC|nr:GroES-like protein [Mollisia scopiformis]KUJ18646.1 GroES-like protein [Mollisia scopiformis]
MKALGVSTFNGPSSLEVLTLPDPKIQGPDDLIVHVHALGLNRSDPMRISGWSRIVETISLPLVMGADFSGTVKETGDNVQEYKIGDRVYGFSFWVHGAGAQYLHLTPETRHFISKMPDGMSFEEMAGTSSICTAICALFQAEAKFGGPGCLKGKTVFVVGGLGGVGNVAVSLAKGVFGAGKVITTVSSGKVGMVEEVFGEGIVDQVVDYGKQDVVKSVGKGKVDFLFDTVGTGMAYVEVVKEGGVLLSLLSKSSETLKRELLTAPVWMCWIVDAMLGVQWWRAGRWGVQYDGTSTNFDGRFANAVEKWGREGKLKPLVGRVIDLGNGEGLKEVKAVLEMIGSTKGTLGKTVVKMDGLSDN